MTVIGLLRAADLRRLERACAPALERRPLPLDLHLDAMGGMDDAARLFVQHLLQQGALLVGQTAGEWEEFISGRRDGQRVLPRA